MKQILVKSLFDCFDYVADYRGTDDFAIISIQDDKKGGFGVEFVPTEHCKEVLTLYFDDAEVQTGHATLFNIEQANQIIRFIRRNRYRIERLIVHCYAGQSRSVAVAAFAVKMLGGNNSRYFEDARPNQLVYETLVNTWNNMKSDKKPEQE